MDWGIALMLGDARQHTPGPMLPSTGSSEITRESAGSQLGTPAYMSPEQANGRVDEFDFRTDVFGLGGMLYEILTGLPPYPGENPSSQLAMARQARVCPPAKAAPGRRLPPGLCRIAMRALAREQDERYQSVGELREDIEAFLRCGGWFESLRFSAGTIIVEEGDEADEAYIIETGVCEAYKIRSGKRHVLRAMGPGEVFGETAIFTGKPRSASVVAVDDVRVIAISREALDYELAERGWLATFVKALAERFREFDARLTKLEADE
jgi:serine/threonine-protein kinase